MPELVDMTMMDDVHTKVPVAKPTRPHKDEISTEEIIAMDRQYNATYYDPVKVAIVKGEGAYAWDAEGKVYVDFAAAQGALNFGHCHPKIVAAAYEQMQTMTIASRAFYNDQMSLFCKEITEVFGYEKVAPMNSGVEGAETAMKLARKWGVMKKGIPESRNKLIFARRGFCGRSIGCISASMDPKMFAGFGPHLPGLMMVNYDDLEALENAFAGDPFISGFYVEPIQGEAGVIVPADGYLKGVEVLCKKYNVLFIADEIQTGVGRTGKLTCCEHDDAKPDILILGKSLSGGLLPVSAVLASTEIMDCFELNNHGSTFGGAPMGMRCARTALKVLKDENLVERAAELGNIMIDRMKEWAQLYPWIVDVRGRGCLAAFELAKDFHTSAAKICDIFKQKGILAKQTHVYSIRLQPTMVMTDDEMESSLDIMEAVLAELDAAGASSE